MGAGERQHGSRTEGRHAPEPSISVVIACYNGQDTLGVQLDALAAQVDPPPFEVILADNASTDSSADLARGYADRIDLRVVDAGQVKGPGHARNVGVAAARADVIAFCDADDEVANDWVRRAHSAIADGEHDFVAGRVDIDKLNTASTRRTRQMGQQEGLQDSAVGVGLKHAGAGNMAFRRQAFEAVGGFDEGLRCLQDSDLCWRMQLAGTRLDYLPDMTIYTRLRSTLRTMARQGYLYGRSFAQLEGRYGVSQERPEDSDDGARPTTGQPVLRRRLDTARRLGVGGVLWHLAWHTGHQVGKRGLQRHPVQIKQHSAA